MVFQDHVPHLAYLVWLSFITIALQINLFFNTLFSKKVMAATDTFFKFYTAKAHK